VQTGLAPNLPLKGVESDLLSLFPVSKVAEALLKNFQISDGTAAVVQSYFNNLKLSPSGRTELAGALRAGLKQEGSLTAEIEAVLTAESAAPEVLVTENAILFHQHPFLQLERYPANKILLTEDERVQLRDEAARQARLSTAEVMAPSLLNLMRYVNAPANYAPLAARARSYMDSFLESENYEKAAQFLQALQEEFERIEDTLSPEQAQPFRSLLDEFCGEERTRKVAQSFRDIHGEGADFQRLLRYFRVVGKAAVPSLMRALEEEESRHARLLICKVIGQIGGQNIPAIAEKLIHPAWYVVRNAVSILGQTGSPKSVQFLRMTLGHDDARVRKEVLRALAAIRSAEAVESLCLALDDPDVSVCKTALGWIAAIESEQALPALQRLLETRAIFKKDDEFLKLTIEAVKAVNTFPAIQSLERLTRTRSFFRRRKAALIRRLARAAVDEMKERYGA
jgi:HEAT repeat protein